MIGEGGSGGALGIGVGDRVAMLEHAYYEGGSPMSEEKMRDELVTMLSDGPTATSLAWAFERLLRHPDKLARLRAVLRRSAPDAGPVIEVGELTIDVPQRFVKRNGERVKLTPHEFDLLRVLAQNRGKLLTHRMLLREVWGPSYQVEAHYLHVYVARLRKKLEPDPSGGRHLITEPGVGYRLLAEEDDSPADR